PEIRDLVGVERGTAVDQLRRVLRGLCHSGDLHIDSRGAYQLAARETTVAGVIRRNERGRLVLISDDAGNALPVRLTRDSRLRVGDRVRARVVEEQAIVADVLERSSDPVVGRIVRGPRGWYVNGEGEFRGRVFLVAGGEGDATDGDTVSV